MTADAHGTQDDLPASGVARASRPSVEVEFVAPVTVGRPQWRRRHTRAVLVVHAAALGCFPGLYLAWQNVVRLPVVAAALSVVALALIGRGALCAWLHQLRRHGNAMSNLLAVGSIDEVAAVVERTNGAAGLGWRVTGACTPTGAGPGGADTVAGVPVIGDLDGIAALALANEVDAVSVAPAPGWTTVRLQHLAWDLDCSRTALLADPRLVPPAGARMEITEVDGLPLLRLDHPVLRGVPRVVKGVTDRLGALTALVLVAPLLVGCAVAVRRDGGPALCRRRRLGRGGREFLLLTFRTTDGAGKPTHVGRVLRRHCLDELPQLLNVLGGSMALVGPRPALPVAPGEAGPAAQGHLLVKPGITGLLQEDGWKPGDPSEGSVLGVDLRYVRNWTPALDARIVIRTVRAALNWTSAHREEQ